MKSPFASPRFKHPEGSPKRFKELQNYFKQSATALYLIDYARDTSVKLVEANQSLQNANSGGDYDMGTRVVRYSRNQPVSYLMHEFRHAVHLDALRKKPEFLKGMDYLNENFSRALMSMSVTEADAEYHRYLVYTEMQGSATKDPLLFFKQFMSERAILWIARAMVYRLEDKHIHTQYRLSPLHTLIMKLEDMFDKRFLKSAVERGIEIEIPRHQREDGIDYLHAFIGLVCRDRDGRNYLLDGKSAQEERNVAGQIWDSIFKADTLLGMCFVERKEQLAQRHAALRLKVQDSLVLGAEYFPFK